MSHPAAWSHGGTTRQGIATQGIDLGDLQQQILEAVAIHFDDLANLDVVLQAL
jgi:hypothetical protein